MITCLRPEFKKSEDSATKESQLERKYARKEVEILKQAMKNCPTSARARKVEKKPNLSTLANELTGQLLVAMPDMPDPRFARAVIYLCSHGPSGAMGLIVNRVYSDADFPMLLDQLSIKAPPDVPDVSIQFGGPVEMGRGFVLHSAEYLRQGTLRIDDSVAITATTDILHDIAHGKGPEKALLILGYAGWSGGQLEEELKNNGWLTVTPDPGLLFDTDLGSKWDRAMAKIGIRPAMLSPIHGNA